MACIVEQVNVDVDPILIAGPGFDVIPVPESASADADATVTLPIVVVLNGGMHVLNAETWSRADGAEITAVVRCECEHGHRPELAIDEHGDRTRIIIYAA